MERESILRYSHRHEKRLGLAATAVAEQDLMLKINELQPIPHTSVVNGVILKFDNSSSHQEAFNNLELQEKSIICEIAKQSLTMRNNAEDRGWVLQSDLDLWFRSRHFNVAAEPNEKELFSQFLNRIVQKGFLEVTSGKTGICYRVADHRSALK